MADPEGLAGFIESLSEGQRHRGFYWAARTAIADGLNENGQRRVERAGIENGLTEEYVTRTMSEARRKQESDNA